MTWTFIFLMLVLKLPILALVWIVWWAIRQAPEPAPGSDGDGGIKHRPEDRPRLGPRRPRRGPHGDPPPRPPSRVRGVTARARRADAGHV